MIQINKNTRGKRTRCSVIWDIYWSGSLWPLKQLPTVPSGSNGFTFYSVNMVTLTENIISLSGSHGFLNWVVIHFRLNLKSNLCYHASSKPKKVTALTDIHYCTSTQDRWTTGLSEQDSQQEIKEDKDCPTSLVTKVQRGSAFYI